MEVNGQEEYGYYQTRRITELATLRSIFEPGFDNELNWLFLSTSGVHGSYLTLDDFDYWSEEDGEPDYSLTVIVLKPRTVQTLYGCVEVRDRADRDWLRSVIEQTMEGIARSQQGNRRLEDKEGKP